jgi:hypothetical protein
MIGFVVQNFSSKTFLTKTQKYNTGIVHDSVQLFYLFIKRIIYIKYDLSWNMLLLHKFNRLYKSVFIKPFWRLFRKMHTRSLGLLTVNLIKSHYCGTYEKLSNLLLPTARVNFSRHQELTCLSTSYRKPVYVLPFSFQKTTYNTIIFFLFFRLVSVYSAPQNDFSLYYSYILRPHNFTVYTFLNLFYFRVKHF